MRDTPWWPTIRSEWGATADGLRNAQRAFRDAGWGSEEFARALRGLMNSIEGVPLAPADHSTPSGNPCYETRRVRRWRLTRMRREHRCPSCGEWFGPVREDGRMSIAAGGGELSRAD